MNPSALSRRRVLGAGLGLAAGLAWPTAFVAAGRSGEGAAVALRLKPQPATARFFGPGGPTTAVWGFNGAVPGPEIRVPQGGRLEAAVENGLAQDTTVHWHGLRIPHAMDGVAHLTQPPIAPGASFDYAFTAPDAGTFWYHPHVYGHEQQGRGLYGALIVEEPEPPRVDRDIVWVIDDWRLDDESAVSESFGHPMDLSHAGRIGNMTTLNGRDSDTFAVRAGERLRLRLVNVANARIFALRFEGHRPRVIALDGQPTTPHEPPAGVVVLPPAGRADLIVDMEGDPGQRFAVTDDRYRGSPFRFVELIYGEAAPVRASPLDAPVSLAANPIPGPDLAHARRHEVVLGGGAMGGMASAILAGRTLALREIARQGKMWAINGIVADRDAMDPLLVFRRGETQILALHNETAFPHPMHLHGHSFRLISRDGREVAFTPWLDTVLVEPRERLEVAFVADNPGDWLFHCHILEHMAAGMGAVFRVA